MRRAWWLQVSARACVSPLSSSLRDKLVRIVFSRVELPAGLTRTDCLSWSLAGHYNSLAGPVDPQKPGSVLTAAERSNAPRSRLTPIFPL